MQFGVAGSRTNSEMALVTSVRRESACSHLSESLTRESSGLSAGHLPHLFVLIVTSCCLSVSSVSLLLFLSPRPGVGGKGSLFLHRQNSLLGLSQASSPFKDILFSSFLQMFFPFFPCIFFSYSLHVSKENPFLTLLQICWF